MDVPAIDSHTESMPLSVPIAWDASGLRVSDPQRLTSIWWESLTGQSTEEANDWGWLETVHPDDRNAARLAWARALAGGEPYIAVYRVRSLSGEWHSVFAHGVPQRSEDGAISGWSGSLIDITAYRRATEYAASISALISALGKTTTTEEILRPVLETLEATMKADAGAVMLLAPDGQTLEVAATFGVEQDNLDEWRTFPASGPYPFAEAVETREPVWIERVSEWRDRWPDSVDLFEGRGFRAVASVPLLEAGSILGAISISFRREMHFSDGDKSFMTAVGLQAARALLLTRLVDAERQARESTEFAHAHLRMVANSFPALISYIDADLRYQFNNAAYREWFQLEQDIAPGTPVIDVIGKAAFDVLLPHFQRALTGDVVELETELQYLGSGLRSISATYVPDLAADGTVRGFSVLVQDISERKRAETRAARLQEFTTTLTQATSLDEVIAATTGVGRAAIHAAAAALFLVEDGEPLLWASVANQPGAVGPMTLPASDDIVHQVVRYQRTLLFQPGDPALQDSPVFGQIAGRELPGPVIVVPIRMKDRASGGLVFALQAAGESVESEVSFAALLADLVAGALNRAELLDSMKEREARFRTLAEALPQIVWVSSGDGSRLEYLNQRWLDYTGMQEGQTHSGKTSDLVHPDDRMREQELWRTSLATGTLFEAEVRLRRHDGVYRWFLSRGVPVRDHRGNVVSWFGTMTDIDEQQRSILHQRFVTELDSRIRLLDDPIQIMQALVATVGEHLPVQRCLLTEGLLDPASRLYLTRPYDADLTDRRITVRACWESVDPPRCLTLSPLWAGVELHFADELRRGRIVHVDNVATDESVSTLRTGLESFDIDSFVIVPFLRAGRWVASLSVHTSAARSWTTDEMTIADAAIKRTWPIVERSRAVEAMRESENRLRHAALAADFGSFDFETATGRGYWTNDVMRVFRRPEGTPALEQLEDFLGLIHPDDRRRVETVIEEASGPHGDGDLHVEFRHLTESGEMCWVLLRGTVDFSGSGDDRQAVRVSGIVMDITKRMREEEERVAFIDAAAHDLKNPVAAIRALAQVAERLRSRDRLEPERLTEILGSIEGATDQLTGVIQDLLDAANMRAGKPLSLHLEHTELVQLLADRVAVSQTMSPTHQIHYLPEDGSISGWWDVHRLQRVFDNLLSNAVKFSPEESTIEVRVASQDGKAITTIADQGIGIAPDDLSRVFDWFQRGTNVPEHVVGTGIGLAGARQIVEQLGGSMSLESEKGKGSTVTVILPTEMTSPV